MVSRGELRRWFREPEQRGVCSNAELADLLEVSEGFVRGEGRTRGCRRIGGAICWTEADALELFDDLETDDEDEDDLEEDESEADEDEDEASDEDNDEEDGEDEDLDEPDDDE